jgi:hypothetical protein
MAVESFILNVNEAAEYSITHHIIHSIVLGSFEGAGVDSKVVKDELTSITVSK